MARDRAFYYHKKPKILLINVPDGNDSRPGEPLGLEYLKSYLEKNKFRVDLFNANIKGVKDESLPSLVKKALQKKYDIVGMTLFTHLFDKTIRLAKIIKKSNPNTLIILGGHHITFSHEAIMRKYSGVDIAVRGEGERTLLEIAKAVNQNKSFRRIKGITYREAENIRINGPRQMIKDLDKLPFPFREPKRYKNQAAKYRTAALISSRGCPANCSFCSITAFYNAQPGKPYRMRSPENLAKEIIYLNESFGVNNIAFKDDNLFIDACRLIKLSDILEEKNKKITFNIISRPDNIVKNRKYLPELYKRGFRSIEVGIEAGSESVLKRFSKQVSIKTNRMAIELAVKNKFRVLMDYIMFEPYMSLSDLKENIAFIRSLSIIPFISKKFIWGNLLHKLALHPGTPYYDKMLKEKSIKGSIFRPRWEFKDKRVGSIHKFIKEYSMTLRKETNKLQRLRVNKLVELSREYRDRTKSGGSQIKMAVLKKTDYDIDMVYLYLLEKAVSVGRHKKPDKKHFKSVKKKTRAYLEKIRNRISRIEP